MLSVEVVELLNRLGDTNSHAWVVIKDDATQTEIEIRVDLENNEWQRPFVVQRDSEHKITHSYDLFTWRQR